MKKFLAVVLALVMTLTMGTAAFAYVEVAPGQVYLGPADAEYYANPGEELTVTFRYAGNPNETDEYPTEGYAVLGFWGIIGHSGNNTIQSFALTQEAVDAGVVLIEDENSMYNSWASPDDASVFATFMMPVELISADFNILTVTTKVADDWKVEDYVAEEPIDIIGYAGDYAMSPINAIFTEEEGAAILAGEMMVDDVAEYVTINGVVAEANATVYAMPYQPTWSEALTEQLKGIGLALLDVLMIGLNLLKGELAPADWFIPGEHDVVDLSFITDGIAALVGLILNG